jgi:hypothetical protein
MSHWRPTNVSTFWSLVSMLLPIKIMKNNEKQWKIMENNEKQWKTMKNNEKQWKTTRNNTK